MLQMAAETVHYWPLSLPWLTVMAVAGSKGHQNKFMRRRELQKIEIP
jgi:hypothetical protein